MMNKKERQAKINNITRLLKSIRSGSDVNKVRFSKGNTWEHEGLKAKKCFGLLKDGHDFVTEAEFKGGGRADIVDLCCGIVYEVLVSESIDSLKEKIKKYPDELDVIAVRGKQK
jgi:hypothetical protein